MVWEYLKRAKEIDINPNFWMSEEYFLHAGFIEEIKDNMIFLKDSEGKIIFPCIFNEGITEDEKCIKNDPWKYWAGFLHTTASAVSIPFNDFLDYNYIYDPVKFIDTSGSKWKLFRKNKKRFTDTIPNYRTLKYKKCKPNSTLLLKWLFEKGIEEIHDDEVLADYFLNPLSDNCKGLYLDDELIGINIWDENWKYINFRYSFAHPEYPFLSYYLRWKFFLDMIQKGKLVNDGGCLGKDSLEFFKDHLNPVSKYWVVSCNWE